MSFAERLGQLIKEKGKTPAQVAKGMGVTHRAIEYLINGRSNPRVTVLCAAADYFEVTTDFLLGRKENRV